MAEETIVGAGEGSEEWALALYQGLDKSGNSLWSFDKNGNLTIKGALTSGSSTIGAGTAVNYAGDLAVNTNKFNVTATSGNTTVAGTLGVTGTTTAAAINASGTVAAAGALTVGTTLGVTGTSTMAAINASGTVAAAGAMTVGTTLGVTGTTTAAAINASGTVAAAAAATVGTTLSVGGALTASAALTVGTTLGVTGATTLAAVSATSGTFSGIVFETGIETPITAHAGGTQAAAFALNTSKPTHVVTTVGSSADSVKLPSATGSGAWHTISNQAATNSLQVYGSGTDTINAVATATGVAVAAGKTASFCDYAAGLWFGQAGA